MASQPPVKSETHVTSAAVNSSDDELPHDFRGPTGQQGKFPIYGLGALFGVLVAASTALAVLICSNNRSQTHWPKRVQPSVILAGINSFANIMLAVGIAQGVAIAWWRRAQRGATIAELHRDWRFSSNIWSVMTGIKSFNVIALSALATKLTIVDNILLQRATSTYVTQDPVTSIHTYGIAAQTFPFTGSVVATGSVVDDSNSVMINDQFNQIVNAWETDHGFFQALTTSFQGCENAVCSSSILAAGFEISCTSNTITHFDQAAPAVEAYNTAAASGNLSNSAPWTNLPLFNGTFTMQWPNGNKDYSRIVFNMTRLQSLGGTSTTSCPSNKTVTSCELRPAVVEYPVTIMNYSNPHIANGVSLGADLKAQNTDQALQTQAYDASNKQSAGFKVHGYIETEEQQFYMGDTTLGGIQAALSQYLGSLATITYTGPENGSKEGTWSLSQQGTLAQTYMYGLPTPGTCDCSFYDPLDYIIGQINQLTFLTSLNQTSFPPNWQPNKTNSTTITVLNGMKETAYIQPLTTLQIADAIHYQTHWLFMALAVASMVICALCVLPSFYGYWEVRREATLGPLEVADAFGAPVLEHQGNYGKTKDLLEDVGKKRVQYGVVSSPPNSPTLNRASQRWSMMEVNNNNVR